MHSDKHVQTCRTSPLFPTRTGAAGLRVRCADPRSRCLLYYELIFAQAFSSLEERFSF